MEATPIVIGLVEIVFTLCLAILTAYASFRVFARLVGNADEIAALKENNASMGVLFASILAAMGLIVREALDATAMTLGATSFHGSIGTAVGKSLAYGLVYVAVALVLAMIGIQLAARLVMKLTKNIDEITQVSNNNMAVAIAMGAVIIMIAFFMSPAIESLLSSMIPYAEVSGLDLPS